MIIVGGNGLQLSMNYLLQALLKLASTTLNSVGDEVDKMGWLELNEGVFSVRSAYNLAARSSEEDDGRFGI